MGEKIFSQTNLSQGKANERLNYEFKEMKLKSTVAKKEMKESVN